MQDHTKDRGYNSEDQSKEIYLQAYREANIENKYLKELLKSKEDLILVLKHQVAVLAATKIFPNEV